MSWDLDAMSVLPEAIQEDVTENFTPEYLAEKLSEYIVQLSLENEILKEQLRIRE